MAPGRDIIVVAASAGGLQPLRTMLSQMPADLAAAVFVVLHVPATGGSTLPRILDRSGPLPAASAIDGDRVQPGRVYVAPPDRHLLMIKDAMRLSRGPRQNGVRPAADPLFRSAALHAGSRVIAVVLSGTLDDASLGSATVERHGGRVVVQDPDDAGYDSMPRHAIGATRDPIVVPASAIAGQVRRLTTEEAADASPPDEELAAEIEGLLAGTVETDTSSRSFSNLTCPECGGPLYRATEQRAETYDCLVGHRWAPQALVEQQSQSVERALWLAIRSLEERDRLLTGMADAARDRGHTTSVGQFRRAAGEAKQSADTIREVASTLASRVAADPGEA